MSSKQWDDAAFQRYWQWLIDEFNSGRPRQYSPRIGNTREIQKIDAVQIQLKEITARGQTPSASKDQVNQDFRRMFVDASLPVGVRAIRSKHRIENLAEFKYAMYLEFLQFVGSRLVRPAPSMPGNVASSGTAPDVSSPNVDPTVDAAELDRRVAVLLGGDMLAVPDGDDAPARVSVLATVFARDPAVKAWVLIAADGNCEGCNSPAPFRNSYGTPFLEVHHMLPLADDGPDTVQNCVALCPNCHRRCHNSDDCLEFRSTIYRSVGRLTQKVDAEA